MVSGSAFGHLLAAYGSLSSSVKPPWPAIARLPGCWALHSRPFGSSAQSGRARQQTEHCLSSSSPSLWASRSKSQPSLVHFGAFHSAAKTISELWIMRPTDKSTIWYLAPSALSPILSSTASRAKSSGADGDQESWLNLGHRAHRVRHLARAVVLNVSSEYIYIYIYIRCLERVLYLMIGYNRYRSKRSVGLLGFYLRWMTMQMSGRVERLIQ